MKDQEDVPIFIGEILATVVPSPRLPYVLSPHIYKAPVDVIAPEYD